MKMRRVKDVLCGMLISTVVFGSITAVYAKVSDTTIPISYRNIKMMVDGKPLNTDKEPFIYNGTTYLPVRAVAEAVGKEVAWDGSAKTVYLGKIPEKTEINKTPDGKNKDIEITAGDFIYEYGMPKVILECKNHTNSDIVRYDLYMQCYDAYGKRLESPDNSYYSLNKIKKGSSGRTNWILYTNGASRVVCGIYKYHTANGQTIEIPREEINWVHVDYDGE